MDFLLLQSLLQNLLHSHVLCMETDQGELAAFESAYCYHPALQPQFTRTALSTLMDDMQKDVIYEIRDELGIGIQFFRFAEKYFIVGPFIKAEFNENKVRSYLITKRVPASFVPSLRVYYSAFPLLSSTLVRNTICACIRSFTESCEDYAYCRLRGDVETVRFPNRSNKEALDYNTLLRRYDIENRFLRMIENGDTEHVLIAFNEMHFSSKNRYINAVYMDPNVSLSMLRALTRKAAERGGASIMEIHEITQRFVQKSLSASVQVQNDCMREMIMELTEAVLRHRLAAGKYSPPVQRTVEYLHLNYSQELNMRLLASRVNLSENYLAALFKQETGLTATQFIANLRCTQAAQMLKETDYSIAEISYYVGYLDNNYFVKVFKKQFQVTPSEYRRQNTHT